MSVRWLVLLKEPNPENTDDELIYIPGRWKYADGSSGFRVTRIYVSSKASTENGRRNWNIPSKSRREHLNVYWCFVCSPTEQVAHFDYNAQDGGSTTFQVTLPGASEPFFKASIKPITVVSYIPIPFNTTILGSFYSLKQPPIPAGDKPEEVGTTQWASLIPVMKGTAYAVSLTPGFPNGKVGDGVAFPAVAPWGVGMVMNNVDLQFGVASFSDSVWA